MAWGVRAPQVFYVVPRINIIETRMRELQELLPGVRIQARHDTMRFDPIRYDLIRSDTMLYPITVL